MNDKYKLMSEDDFIDTMILAARHADAGHLGLAITMVRSIFDEELARNFPDNPLYQCATVDLGQFLFRAGKSEEAAVIFEIIEHGKCKPAEWYLNYSQALNTCRRYLKAERVAMEGLRLFPEDVDLAENLRCALYNQKNCGGDMLPD